MSNQPHSLLAWQLITLVAALILCGYLNTASGQLIRDFEATPTHTSNPKTNVSRIPRKRSDKLSHQPSTNLPSSPAEARPDEKQQEIEKAIEQGNKARDRNDYEEALTHYKDAQNLNPQEARAFHGMGNLYADLYCYDSAIEAYRKTLELQEDYLEAHIGLGYAYLNKERYDDAWEQFQAALKLAPKNIWANLGLGNVYAKKGKYQEAIEQINKVINDQSIEGKDQAAAHVTLGLVYDKQGKSQEAIAQYEKAIKLNSNLAAAYLQLGSIQTTAAFSDLSSFNSISEISLQALATFRASAKQATDNLERAKEHGYNHPNLYELLAMSLAYQSRYQDAASNIKIYFEKVEELEKGLPSVAAKCGSGFNRLNAEGHWELGYVHYTESLFEADEQRKTDLVNEAIKEFNQAINLRQDYVQAYWMMALSYTKQQKYEEALSQYKNAIRYGAEESYKGNLYLGIGSLYSRMGRYDEALEHLREANRLDPNNPNIYETLASIYVSQGNLEETFNLLKKATEVRTTSSTNPNPYFYLGTTYIVRFLKKKNEEDFNEGIKWLKKAIEIKPTYVDAYIALGSAYDAHSNADEALTNYKKAAEYDPKNPKLYSDMADIYSNLKHNDDAAIGLLKQAIEIKPTYAAAHYQLGLMYHRKDNDAEAIKQMLEAIKYDPKYLDAYYDLAGIYKAQKNYSEAIKLLTKTTEIAPTNFQPYKEIAKVYEAEQKNDDAVHYYEEAINRLDADDSSTKNLYLGRIERLHGHYTEAIGYFQKLAFPDGAGQMYYDIGITYVVSKNRIAALEQHQQLVKMKSPLAEDLLKRIKEMN